MRGILSKHNGCADSATATVIKTIEAHDSRETKPKENQRPKMNKANCRGSQAKSLIWFIYGPFPREKVSLARSLWSENLFPFPIVILVTALFDVCVALQ
jgi:hypothetical protein